MTKNKLMYISNCCKADIIPSTIVYGNPYRCLKCGNPCYVILNPTNKNKEAD